MPTRLLWFLSRFHQFGNRIAIIYQDEKYTYGDLLNSIESFAIKIQQKIAPGETVALITDYSFSSIASFFSLMANKNIIVPIISSNKIEIEKKILISNVSKYISFHDDAVVISETKKSLQNPLLKKLVDAGHSGLVLFSSGTTGEPKAMLHDLDLLIDSYKKNIIKDINSIIFLTFDHIGGIDTLFSLLSIGGTITIPENRDPNSVCKLIENHKVDVLSASPTFYNLMIIGGIYQHYNLNSLKILGYGAEKMPEYLLNRLKQIFPKASIQQKFGTSETNAIRVRNHPTKDLYIKIEDPNIQYKIVNEELWLKSKTQILGYLNDSINNFENGWFKTGDIVDQTEDGYFKIIGRITERINVGGEKVFPGEVEDTILQIKHVEDCLVYGEPNLITGQIVVAEVIINLTADTQKVKNEIKYICQQKLEKYKWPAKIRFVSSFSINDRYKKIRKK